MFQRTTLLFATLLVVNAQSSGPFFSYSTGGPSSSSPFSSSGPPSFGSGGPPSFNGGGPPPFSSSGPPPFSSGGPPSSGFGGPYSTSPFGGGGPSSSPFSSGGPSGRPGPGNRPSKAPKNGNKLFSWIGSTMSKLQGLGPKVHYYPPKSKPSSNGGPSLSSSPQNAPPYFSSGGPPPPRDPYRNSIYEGSNSSPFEGGSTVSFPSSSHSNSLDHPKVIYRNRPGPPSSYNSRPGPPSSSFSSSRPSYSSRPPPSYSSGGPPPSFSSGGPPPSFSSGGPPPSYSSGGPPPSFSSGGPPPSFSSGGPPPSFSSGGPPPYSSPFSSSRPPFGGPSLSSFSPTRNNLEVFPSQQVSYQSQTLNQNEPGYDDALDSLQNLYGSQSNNKPSFSPNHQSYSNYEQQGSYSQNQRHVSKTSENNYGASFHSIEPVRVAPIYDVGQHFKPSASDMSGSSSNVRSKQHPSNVHDTPFTTIVNEYAAHADAATAGSEQMLNAFQGASDMDTSASTNEPVQGVQIMGQDAGAANPVFEVLADANAPTYDGHPVDLNRLIGMIEPGAQIDTMPSFGDADMGASEQQPVFAEAPSNLELESDAAMASGLMSGNKTIASETSQSHSNNMNRIFDSINDKLKSVASESRPTVVKLDGTRLGNDELIKEYFDKEIILDDLQGNKGHGFVIVGVHTDNDTGDQDEDANLHGTYQNWTTINSFDRNTSNLNDNDDLLAIVQQLRNSANSAIVDRFKNDSTSLSVASIPTNNNDTIDAVEQLENMTTVLHPNHNYYPELSPKVILEETNEHDNETRLNISVINPIFDSVRQSSLSDADNNRTRSLTPKTEDDHDDIQENNDNDNDDDEGDFLSEDMIMGDDGDLAASGARNVKSVAIIVTPPPNYVKIRNKYKKAFTPLSEMTSSTTQLPNISSSLPPTSLESININEAFSESLTLADNNFRSNISNNETKQENIQNDESSLSVTSSFQSNLPNETGINENHPISNVSTISGGVDINHFRDTISSNGTLIDNSKPTRRYPVYRGRSNA